MERLATLKELKEALPLAEIDVSQSVSKCVSAQLSKRASEQLRNCATAQLRN